MKPDERNIVLDFKTLKALSVEARLSILRELNKKQKTLSELSEKLNLKPSTLKEHLEKLEQSGLVERENTDRKWKYYSITRKGKDIVEPKERKVMFSLFASFLIAIISGFMFIKQFLREASYKAKDTVQETSPQIMKTAETTKETVSHTPELNIWFYLLSLSLLILGILTGYLIQKKTLKNNQK